MTHWDLFKAKRYPNGLLFRGINDPLGTNPVGFGTRGRLEFLWMKMEDITQFDKRIRWFPDALFSPSDINEKRQTIVGEGIGTTRAYYPTILPCPVCEERSHVLHVGVQAHNVQIITCLEDYKKILSSVTFGLSNNRPAPDPIPNPDPQGVNLYPGWSLTAFEGWHDRLNWSDVPDILAFLIRRRFGDAMEASTISREEWRHMESREHEIENIVMDGPYQYYEPYLGLTEIARYLRRDTKLESVTMAVRFAAVYWITAHPNASEIHFDDGSKANHKDLRSLALYRPPEGKKKTKPAAWVGTPKFFDYFKDESNIGQRQISDTNVYYESKDGNKVKVPMSYSVEAMLKIPFKKVSDALDLQREISNTMATIPFHNYDEAVYSIGQAISQGISYPEGYSCGEHEYPLTCYREAKKQSYSVGSMIKCSKCGLDYFDENLQHVRPGGLLCVPCSASKDSTKVYELARYESMNIMALLPEFRRENLHLQGGISKKRKPAGDLADADADGGAGAGADAGTGMAAATAAAAAAAAADAAAAGSSSSKKRKSEGDLVKENVKSAVAAVTPAALPAPLSSASAAAEGADELRNDVEDKILEGGSGNSSSSSSKIHVFDCPCGQPYDKISCAACDVYFCSDSCKEKHECKNKPSNKSNKRNAASTANKTREIKKTCPACESKSRTGSIPHTLKHSESCPLAKTNFLGLAALHLFNATVCRGKCVNPESHQACSCGKYSYEKDPSARDKLIADHKRLKIT